MLAIPLLVLFGCTEPTNPVDSIELSPNRVSLGAGDTLRLTATLRAHGGSELPNRTITWSSSDTAVVTVSTDGLVTGVAGGAAIVRAQSDNRVGAAAVTVFGGGPRVQPGDTVVLDQPKVVLISGETAQLDALILRAGGDTAVAVAAWQSSDDRVASVSASGFVTAEGLGTALISGSVPGAPPAVAEVGVAPTFATISAGSEHTCGVTTDGQAFCWGVGTQGQLGTGETSDHPEPAPVLVTNEVYTTVDVGLAHTCALTDVGQVQCWGGNARGQLGIGSLDGNAHPLRSAVTGGLAFTALSVGSDHTCAVTVTNETVCWGRGDAGQLGDLLRATRTAPDSVGVTAGAVGAAVDHTCAVTTQSDAYCWGSNAQNKLGSDAVSGLVTEQVTFDNMFGIWGSSSTDIFAVGNQADSTCTAPGPSCMTNIWHNDGGGWTAMDALPAHLNAVWGTGPADVFAVGTGGSVFHFDGAMWTEQRPAGPGQSELLQVWGAAADDVFATGFGGTVLHYDGVNWTAQTTPNSSDIIGGIWGTSGTDVWAGSFRATGDGDLLHYDGMSWSVGAPGAQGNDLWGRSATDIFAAGDGDVWYYDGLTWRAVASLGVSNPAGSPLALGVWGLGDSVFVVVQHWACQDGGLACIPGDAARLFYNDGTAWSLIATDEPAASGNDVWVGGADAVYVVTGWGGNQFLSPSEEGRIMRLEKGSPTLVVGGNQFASITAGDTHTCAMTPAGAGWCWGDNVTGQLGIGSAASRAPTPTAVTGGLSFAQLSAGATHTCGLTTSGAIYCWGENRLGEVGDGSTTLRRAPVQVAFDEPMIDVTAGNGYSCAVSVRGVGFCWGTNAVGQMGTGSLEASPVPVRVTGPR